MNDDVKNILNNLLGSKHIDSFTLYKFLKGNVAEVDELLNVVDSLLKENKLNGSEAFVLIEYLSSLKLDIRIKEIEPIDIGIEKPDWWQHPYVTDPTHPYVTEPIYVKTSPSTSPTWNGSYTISSQPTSNYCANNNTCCKNHNKR